MTCLHCGAINKDTANFCKDCGMKFTTQKEQDIGTHEEKLYEIAMEELESRSYIKGIWAKAFSQSDADEQRAKALYIKFRVQSLKEELMAKRKLEEERAKQEKMRFQKEAEERERIRIQKEAQERERIRIQNEVQERERIRVQKEAQERERIRIQNEAQEKERIRIQNEAQEKERIRLQKEAEENEVKADKQSWFIALFFVIIFIIISVING